MFRCTEVSSFKTFIKSSLLSAAKELVWSSYEKAQNHVTQKKLDKFERKINKQRNSEQITMNCNVLTHIVFKLNYFDVIRRSHFWIINHISLDVNQTQYLSSHTKTRIQLKITLNDTKVTSSIGVLNRNKHCKEPSCKEKAVRRGKTWMKWKN